MASASSSRACRAAEPRDPGHHRIAHRRRDLLTAGGEHLGDEERIAAGHPVQLAPRPALTGGQRRHRIPRERREANPLDSPLRRQITQHDPQRVRRLELIVAVRRDDQRGDRLETAGEQSAQRPTSPRRPSARPRGREPSASAFAAHRAAPRRTSRGPPSATTSASSSPPTLSATSNSGPSGLGVNSASHAPHSTRARPAHSSQNRRTSAVLPTPASPPTSTSRPGARTPTRAQRSIQRLQLSRTLEHRASCRRVRRQPLLEAILTQGKKPRNRRTDGIEVPGCSTPRLPSGAQPGALLPLRGCERLARRASDVRAGTAAGALRRATAARLAPESAKGSSAASAIEFMQSGSGPVALEPTTSMTLGSGPGLLARDSRS